MVLYQAGKLKEYPVEVGLEWKSSDYSRLVTTGACARGFVDVKTEETGRIVHVSVWAHSAVRCAAILGVGCLHYQILQPLRRSLAAEAWDGSDLLGLREETASVCP